MALVKYNQNDEVKEDMGGTCGMHYSELHMEFW
jgi:hypothetical protein